MYPWPLPESGLVRHRPHAAELTLTTITDGVLAGLSLIRITALVFKYLQSPVWLENAERVIPGCAPWQVEAL
jgi:hypothetical protein